MFINITDSATSNNKGSSGGLVNYLEKENKALTKNSPELWFNDKSHRIQPFQVRHAIDNNIAKLCKAEAKFFLVNISPSQKELKYLSDQFGAVNLQDQMKFYAQKVMDSYAENFKREGINSASDLLWFGKLEQHRYYSYKDPKVKNGLKTRGEAKDGKQLHIQIIVSRKDFTNKIKLSPMNNSKGTNKEHSKKLGQFNRLAFKQSGENLFDELFKFDRQLKDTLAYANIVQNGSLAQKEQLSLLVKGEIPRGNSNQLSLELVKKVSLGEFNTISEMLVGVGKTVDGFIELMLENRYENDVASDPIGKAEKRRLKRLRQINRGMGI